MATKRKAKKAKKKTKKKAKKAKKQRKEKDSIFIFSKNASHNVSCERRFFYLLFNLQYQE